MSATLTELAQELNTTRQAIYDHVCDVANNHLTHRDTVERIDMPGERGLTEMEMTVSDAAIDIIRQRLHGADKATSYRAQIKDANSGAKWYTVNTADTGRDAAWVALANDMQRRGLRYGELASHIADMENGDVLSAEDGTEYRILAPGQEDAQ